MEEERIRYAVEHTEVLKEPRRSLSTFGTTNIHYFLLTEPVYKEPGSPEKETVIREGNVVAERPKIVTPDYLLNLEGFSKEARQYFEMARREVGPHATGILYAYKNQPENLTIVSEELLQVSERLKEMIEKEDRPLTAILKGVDELWDVSILKFIFSLTRGSVPGHVEEMGRRGYFDVDRRGLPAGARQRIEEMFTMVKEGRLEPGALKTELDRWGVFDEYEDRFLALFRRGK
ncbi:MAG: hypothetical protein HY673_22265 [Chloroflexi bacterium]|nr:hypothetical protein [Chloroflexota bacterium]